MTFTRTISQASGEKVVRQNLVKRFVKEVQITTNREVSFRSPLTTVPEMHKMYLQTVKAKHGDDMAKKVDNILLRIIDRLVSKQNQQVMEMQEIRNLPEDTEPNMT